MLCAAPLPITHEETRIPPMGPIGRSQSVPASPPISAVSDPVTVSPMLLPEPPTQPLAPLSASASSLIPVPTASTTLIANPPLLRGPTEVND